jgi:hypothetical protein
MIPEAYTRFRDELVGLLDERFYTADWLDCQVFNGAIRVMGDESAAILFKFERYPTGWLELQGMAAAGDLATIKDELIPAAEALAQGMGCKSAIIESRAAWVRLLPDYTQHQVRIIKEL